MTGDSASQRGLGAEDRYWFELPANCAEVHHVALGIVRHILEPGVFVVLHDPAVFGQLWRNRITERRHAPEARQTSRKTPSMVCPVSGI